MNRYDIQLDILIGVLYLITVIVGNEANFFLMITIFLIYGILKGFLHILMIKEFRYEFMSYIILVYLFLAQFLYAGIGMFIVINIMMIYGLHKYIRVILSILSIAIAYTLFPEMANQIAIFGVFSIQAMVMFEENLKKMTKNKKHISELKQNVDKLNVQVVLNKRYEDEISTISRLEERNMIAQQLHDKLGHTIAGNIIQIEAINTIIDHDVDKAKERLNIVKDNLGEGMNEVRSLLKSMKPETSSMNIERIKSLVKETEALSDIKVVLTHDDVIKAIDYQVWKVIIINIRECLTNMMKYSSASRCSIRISRLNKNVRVHIFDDGIGCNNIKKGMGLIGMEERLNMVNGQLMVDGSDGFNTVMLIDLEGNNEHN